MNRDDLIERLDKMRQSAKWAAEWETLAQTITALSPVLSEDVQAITGRLQFRIAKLSGPGWLMPNCVDDLTDAKHLIERMAADIEAGKVIMQTMREVSKADQQRIEEMKGDKISLAKCHETSRAKDRRIEELAEELDNEQARGIHSCGPNCKRPLCVANRQIAEYEKALEHASLHLWWDGNEPNTTDRLESWLTAELKRIRGME